MKRILSIFFLILIIGSTRIIAQTPGTLDSSYGINGKLSGYFPARNGSSIYFYDLHNLPEGKMIGILNKSFYDEFEETYFDTNVIVKVLANGNADPSFGVNGELKTNLSPLFILPQQDGKLLIGFNEKEELILKRYSNTGILDMSYGFEGTSYTGIFAEINKGIQEINGDLILLGSIKNNTEMVIAKLKSNGERKFDFGKDGLHFFDFDENNLYEWPTQILLQKDGKIVVIGNEYNGGNYAFVCRLNTDGSFDSTFSADGKLLINSTMGTSDAKLLDNGKIILGGTYYYSNYTKSGFTLVSINSNGTMDATFGSTGYRNFNFGGQNDILNSILVQEDGKILAGGSTADKLALARINTNGSYDLNFNATGKSSIEFDAGSTSIAYYMNFEADQKINVGGIITRSDSSIGFCSARFYLGNTVGLLERENSMQVSLYPNPFKEIINIEASLKGKEMLSANLYSIDGKFIENLYAPTQNSLGNQSVELKVNTTFGKGIYLIQIIIDDQEKWVKVIKE
jgi:uncharacterized delta-60 repeat protein